MATKTKKSGKYPLTFKPNSGINHDMRNGTKRMEAPTTDTIRDALLSKANALVASRRTSFSAICTASGVESKFLARVEKGENFSVKTYQKVMDWLDRAEKETIQ